MPSLLECIPFAKSESGFLNLDLDLTLHLPDFMKIQPRIAIRTICPRQGNTATLAIYSAQNGSESRFRVKCLFFWVDLCYILWSVLLHHLFCIAPLWESNCTIGFVCASVSQYYLSLELSGKVVFFHLFCHLSFYLFAPAAIVHSFSNYIVALRDDR